MIKIMYNQAFTDIKQIFLKGVASVQPVNLINLNLNYDSHTETIKIQNKSYNIKHKNLYLFGAGKAVKHMSLETETILKNRIKYGVISIPFGSLDHSCNKSNVYYFEGAKDNLPDSQAFETAKKIAKSLDELKENDFVLFLMSGGGSALLPIPIEPVMLDEKTNLIKTLANFGADIKELNIVRKKISAVKGGKLAAKCYPAQMATLILSDIVGDPIDLIGSGPTVANHDDPFDAKKIVEKYELFDRQPISIKKILTSQCENKFPMDKVDNFIIGSNNIAVSAAVKEAKQLNYSSLYMTNKITGDINVVATWYIELCKILCQYSCNNITADNANILIKRIHIPDLNFDINNVDLTKDICLVFGGETTVKVEGTGKGGRNQELALKFALLLDENISMFCNHNIYFLSAGTDGIDGPTDAAGAISYVNLISDCSKENFTVKSYVDNNDSYSFFKKFQHGSLHIITGHTNTNVMDLQIIILSKKL